MPYKNPEDRKKNQAKWRANNLDYHKKYWKKNGKKYTKYSSGRQQQYKANVNNKLKVKARNAVYYAVKTKKLIRPIFCSQCNKKCKPEADHRDYNKPLEVVWLCKQCHQWFTTNRPVILNKKEMYR